MPYAYITAEKCLEENRVSGREESANFYGSPQAAAANADYSHLDPLLASRTGVLQVWCPHQQHPWEPGRHADSQLCPISRPTESEAGVGASNPCPGASQGIQKLMLRTYIDG